MCLLVSQLGKRRKGETSRPDSRSAWGGNKVTVCLCVCCDRPAHPAANNTQTHFISPPPSPAALVSNHQESIFVWHAACITSNARLQKGEHIVASPGLTKFDRDAPSHTHKYKYTHTRARAWTTKMLIFMPKGCWDISTSLSTPVLLTQTPLIHSCLEWKKPLVPTVMWQMMREKIQHTAGRENNSIVLIQSQVEHHAFHFTLSLTVKKTFLCWQRMWTLGFCRSSKDSGRLKKRRERCVSFSMQTTFRQWWPKNSNLKFREVSWACRQWSSNTGMQQISWLPCAFHYTSAERHSLLKLQAV